MLIERSQDRGKSWSVYQYFAQDCGKSFPGVPTHERRSLTDVVSIERRGRRVVIHVIHVVHRQVCTSQYTKVDKSTEGELTFSVVPSTAARRIKDPYAMEVQNLLKVTDLRINFTQLQTLGKWTKVE